MVAELISGDGALCGTWCPKAAGATWSTRDSDELDSVLHSRAGSWAGEVICRTFGGTTTFSRDWLTECLRQQCAVWNVAESGEVAGASREYLRVRFFVSLRAECLPLDIPGSKGTTARASPHRIVELVWMIPCDGAWVWKPPCRDELRLCLVLCL